MSNTSCVTRGNNVQLYYAFLVFQLLFGQNTHNNKKEPITMVSPKEKELKEQRPRIQAIYLYLDRTGPRNPAAVLCLFVHREAELASKRRVLLLCLEHARRSEDPQFGSAVVAEVSVDVSGCEWSLWWSPPLVSGYRTRDSNWRGRRPLSSRER